MRKLGLITIGLGVLILVGIALVAHSNADKSSRGSNHQTVTGSAAHSRKTSQTNGKSIVIYMTHTGNTKTVAKAIQQQTGADIFQLETQEHYPTSYPKMLKIARTEQNNNARPALAGKLPNLKSYKHIFLGYPIWLDKNPMAINTFLSHYPSFKGQTIIPFTTSGSSGLGSSVPELKKNAKGAQFNEGLAITDSQLGDTNQIVKNWVKKNNL